MKYGKVYRGPDVMRTREGSVYLRIILKKVRNKTTVLRKYLFSCDWNLISNVASKFGGDLARGWGETYIAKYL